ncbi:hypothetical protein HGB13_03335 [bacterium]|nr:hypothetical protein [bacterium]
MKKNKSKKLKKQFKKLLHEHINKAIENKGSIKKESPIETADIEIEKIVEKNKNTSDVFAKNDILKTVLIASVLIILMVIIGYFFNKNNLFKEVINFITNLFR